MKDDKLSMICTQKIKIYNTAKDLFNRVLGIYSLFYNIFIRFYLYTPKGFSVKKSVCQSDFEFFGFLSIWIENFYKLIQTNLEMTEARYELF